MTVMVDKPPTPTLSPCMADPVRWDVGGDDPELKALCRACPRRWRCAKEALHTPGVDGMVAGIHVAKDGRGRAFAPGLLPPKTIPGQKPQRSPAVSQTAPVRPGISTTHP